MSQMKEALGPLGAWLVAAGGVAYTVGAIIYARKYPDPWVRAAACCCAGCCSAAYTAVLMSVTLCDSRPRHWRASRTLVPHACVQPKTFGYHELFHAATIVASICHFSAVYILVHQDPAQLLHT